MNEAQFSLLCQELDQKIHLTTFSIRNFVEASFGISYSQSGMTNLLHKLVPVCLDEQLKESFIRSYLDYMENKPSDKLVFFAGGVHPQHNSLPSYGWIRKGENRELKVILGVLGLIFMVR
ncbi:MAG: transposase [Francisellaceae bacterium]|nr:transposase [Francisellaceae bacterium]